MNNLLWARIDQFCLRKRENCLMHSYALYFVDIPYKNYINQEDQNGNTVLTKACFKGVNKEVQALLNLGAEVNLRRSDGATPLWIAACHNHVHVISTLIDHDADIDLRTPQGTTPLYIAAERSNLGAVQKLLSHNATVDLLNNNKKTPLWIAAKRCHSVKIVKLLHEHGADLNVATWKGESALYTASKSGRRSTVRYLLKHGANIESAKNTNGNMALHVACKCKRQDVIEILLKAGASVNARNKIQDTPLIIAAEKGHREICNLLLLSGADVTAVNKEGNSALHYACAKGFFNTTTLLLDSGASKSIKPNNLGKLPHDLAEQHDNIQHLLESYQPTRKVKSHASHLDELREGLSHEKTDDGGDSAYAESTVTHSSDTDHEKTDSISSATGTDLKDISVGPKKDSKAKISLKQIIIPGIPEAKPMEVDKRKELEGIYSEFLEKTNLCMKCNNVIHHVCKGKSKMKMYVFVERGKLQEARDFVSECYEAAVDMNLFEFKEGDWRSHFLGPVLKPLGPGSMLTSLPSEQDVCKVLTSEDVCSIQQIGSIPSCCSVKCGTLACIAKDQFGNYYAVTAKHPFDESIGVKVDSTRQVLSDVHIENEHLITKDVLHLSSGYRGILDIIHVERAKFCIVDIALSPFSKDANSSLFVNPVKELTVAKFQNVMDNMIVEKVGASTGETLGIVLENDYAESGFGRGIIIVKALKMSHASRTTFEITDDFKFADQGDSGALVKICQYEGNGESSGLGLGIVYKTLELYVDMENGKEYKDVTLCVWLDNCLESVRQNWNLQLTLYDQPLPLLLCMQYRKNNTVSFS